MDSTQRVDTTTLTRLLDNHREYRGLTWHQVAEETGINVMTLYAYRNRKRIPSGDALATLLWWLDVRDIRTVIVRRDGGIAEPPASLDPHANTCSCCHTPTREGPPRYRSDRAAGPVCWECSFEHGCAHPSPRTSDVV